MALTIDGSFGRRGLDFDRQPRLDSAAQRRLAEGGDRRQIAAELFDEHLDLRGRVDAHHVVVADIGSCGIGGHRAGQNHRMEREL